MDNKIVPRVGISSCLLGKKVRFDKGHKHDRYLTDTLGAFVKFVPVCPEVEIGMGVPREAVRLEGPPDAIRMVGNKTGEDWTVRMSRFSRERVRQEKMADLSGFILKNRSPSCGMERVKLYIKPGTVEKKGVGLFARALMSQHPLLPVEEEGRLSDPGLRDNFIVRLFAYNRLRQLFRGSWRRADLIGFHAAHKYLMLAHSPKQYTELGRLVARVKSVTPTRFRDEYSAGFMAGLKMKATIKKNVNVLQHIAGFFKNRVDEADRKAVAEVIEDYRRELVPLVAPITLVRHLVRKHDIAWIRDQVYLNPHPKELMLRNHV